jgi:hypothetical protein
MLLAFGIELVMLARASVLVASLRRILRTWRGILRFLNDRAGFLAREMACAAFFEDAHSPARFCCCAGGLPVVGAVEKDFRGSLSDIDSK